jgi:RNA polymerase sigma-70 factor, ECF subfamily
MRVESLTSTAPLLPGDTVADRARVRHALDTFLRGVESRAFRLAQISCGSRDEALDVVQDSMLRFVRSYQSNAQAEWPLLFWRVLDSRIVDFHRRRSARSRWMGWLAPKSGDPEQDDVLARVADESEPGPLNRLGDREALIALERALGRLPLRQRQAFLLRVWQGLDVAQTAIAMNLSEGSVKTHLFRALQQLRTRLEAHHD